MRFNSLHDCTHLIVLKSFIIISGSLDQQKCSGVGREAYNSLQTFVILRGYVCTCVRIYLTSICTYYVHICTTYMYIALYRPLEALRGKTLAVQSAGGILTRLIQSIICRGTSSPSALLPDSVAVSRSDLFLDLFSLDIYP